MDRRRLGLVLAFLVLATVELGWIRAFQPLDRQLADALLRQHVAARAQTPEVVLVAIDEHSLDAMADTHGRYPWPRSTHAAVLEYLARQGAAAVVFDILFSDPDLDRPDADGWFVETAVASPNAYFPLVILDQHAEGLALDEWGERLGFAGSGPARAGLLLPLTPLALTGRTGSINFLPDEDGVGRRYAVRTRFDGWSIPSLPARVASALNGVEPEPDAVIINWRGRPGERATFSYARVLLDAERRSSQIDRESFAGRVVVIGATAPALHDLRQTPLSDLHPGSDILAAAIETLRARDWLRMWPAALAVTVAVALMLGIALAFRWLVSPLRVGAVLAVVSLVLIAGEYLALASGWVTPVAAPLFLGWLFYLALALDAWLRERQQRARAVQMFGRFVDPRVVGSLVGDDGGGQALGGERRRITLLFSDIRGFTTLSESRTPEQIVALLNTYFSRQVDVIFRHGGTVDKFIGDAIMAFWGAPLDDADQARNAVAAAIDMSRVVDELRSELGEAGRDFDIGIGLHTGDAVVGFIGAEHRLEYTAIGDTVNLASRIEGLTKGLARVLVSQSTRDGCGDAFEFDERGSHKVKGRSAEVILYEPRVPERD